MEQALTGYKVLDFGHYIAGPYAAMLLAEQGAEVIKIEPPGGDPFRDHPGFMVWNRSKKSIILDLKTDQGREIARTLAKKADIIVENYKPGVTDRLGISYEDISAVNSKCVYCSITGFGQTGPYRDLPGWDPIVESITGSFVAQGGLESPPVYLVLPFPSYYASFLAAFSITTALVAREISGKGQKVDISLFGAMLASGATGYVDFEDKVRIPTRDAQGSSPLYRFYRGSDGKWFFLGLGNLTFFSKFALAMEHDEWLYDDRFEGAPFVILPPISDEIIAEFQEIFDTRTRDEWLEFLQSEDIPCSAAQPVEEFMNDPQVLANKMVAEIEEPGLGIVRQMGVPVRLDELPGSIKGPSPKPGEHSREILESIGYSEEQINTFNQ